MTSGVLVNVAVGVLVAVGGAGVFVTGRGVLVAVDGTGVTVGGTEVLVGWIGVSVGGTSVLVGGTTVLVAAGESAGGSCADVFVLLATNAINERISKTVMAEVVSKRGMTFPSARESDPP